MPGARKRGATGSSTVFRAAKGKPGSVKKSNRHKPEGHQAGHIKTAVSDKGGVKIKQVKALSAKGKSANKRDADNAVSNVSRMTELKNFLLAKRVAILNEAKQEISKYMSGEHRQVIDTAIDEGDWAAIDISEDLNLKRLSAQRQTLLDIEECLRKINEGTYGICEECGEEISAKRLKVLPTARFCIDCKENMERMAAIEEEPEI